MSYIYNPPPPKKPKTSHEVYIHRTPRNTWAVHTIVNGRPKVISEHTSEAEAEMAKSTYEARHPTKKNKKQSDEAFIRSLLFQMDDMKYEIQKLKEKLEAYRTRFGDLEDN